MPTQLTKIIGWAPDLPVTTPGSITVCRGIVPTVRGIGSPPIFTATSSGTLDSATVVGAVQLAKANGTLRRFVGTSAKLWEFDGTTTLTDRSGTAYSASATQGWSFTAFGDVALASNKGNTIQKSTTGAFSDLSTAPKAAIICTVGPPSSPFIMAFNYDSGGGSVDDGWFCSGIADYTTWNSVAAQSVFGRLLEPTGPFTAAIPFRDGVLAWKANAMYRGDYVGAPAVWQWTRIATDIGCCGKNMAVASHDTCYFADKRGLWVYDGSYPRRMEGFVHDYWGSLVAGTAITGASSVNDTCQMKVDPLNQNIWISFKDQNSAACWLIYNTTSTLWAGTDLTYPFLNTAGSAVNSIIDFSPTFFVTAADSKVNTGTFASSSSGTGSYLQPMLRTWAVGDPDSFVSIDRVRPFFTVSASGAGTALDASSTCRLLTNNDSAYSTTSFGTAVLIDTTRGQKFDMTSSATSDNFVAAELTLIGKWQMSHIGLSLSDGGTRGKR